MTRWLIGATFLLGACRPELDETNGWVSSPRVLAVQSEPAEAQPGVPLRFRALIGDPAARASTPSWFFCTAPKPPIENNSVARECLGSAALLPAGEGTEITASLPSDACARFGPDTPPGNFRPRDPDVTGGYYQPLRVQLTDTDAAFHLQRVRCPLADASADSASELAAQYVDNRNPTLAPVRASSALDRIPPGATLELVASWSRADAENYAYFDRSRQSVTTRREAMRVAWYVTGGRLERETSGRAESDLETSTSNRWQAPDQPGSYRLWIVLRDSRGGTDWASEDLVVVP